LGEEEREPAGKPDKEGKIGRNRNPEKKCDDCVSVKKREKSGTEEKYLLREGRAD